MPLESITKDHAALIKKLIECDAEIDAFDDYGYSPVWYVSIWSCPSVMRILIDNGADLTFSVKFMFDKLINDNFRKNILKNRILIDTINPISCKFRKNKS